MRSTLVNAVLATFDIIFINFNSALFYNKIWKQEFKVDKIGSKSRV